MVEYFYLPLFARPTIIATPQNIAARINNTSTKLPIIFSLSLTEIIFHFHEKRLNKIIGLI